LAGTGALADKRKASVDVNSDGSVNNADLVELLRKMN
ncbi:MAG: hypothetical protein II370_01080, partial [Clostridia bacterium]|nr:hypothetical protein [Clostridia bacterium]